MSSVPDRDCFLRHWGDEVVDVVQQVFVFCPLDVQRVAQHEGEPGVGRNKHGAFRARGGPENQIVRRLHREFANERFFVLRGTVDCLRLREPSAHPGSSVAVKRPSERRGRWRESDLECRAVVQAGTAPFGRRAPPVPEVSRSSRTFSGCSAAKVVQLGRSKVRVTAPNSCR